MKKFYVLFSLGLSFILLQSGVQYSSVPPTGRTGATGTYCTSCHGSFALNTAGSISVTGLPTSGYVPSTAYPFSLTITHNTADRKVWGFSMKAVNSGGSSVGSFSSSNASASTNGTELSHNGAPTTSASGSYTFDNLKWTAPATSAGNVTFYYVGIAGDDANGNSGDYVYAGSSVFALPIKLKTFTAVADRNVVLLKWQTASEVNSDLFDVERSDDGQFYKSIGTVKANVNTSTLSSYSYQDNKAASSGGNIFYRLKMVDQDGSSKYSNVVSVKPQNTSLYLKNVYPVVISGGNNLTIEAVSDKAKTLSMSIIDASGRVYLTKVSNLVSGANTLQLTTPSALPKGMIFLMFNTEGFQQTESLIIR